MINNVYEKQTFNSIEDVWDVIDLIIDDTKTTAKETGLSLDIDKSITTQLSFFCCPSIFNSREIQRDIEKYTYCKDNNVPPHKGAFGEQPAKWVDKFFTIKNAFAKKEQTMIDKMKKERNG